MNITIVDVTQNYSNYYHCLQLILKTVIQVSVCTQYVIEDDERGVLECRIF